MSNSSHLSPPSQRLASLRLAASPKPNEASAALAAPAPDCCPYCGISIQARADFAFIDGFFLYKGERQLLRRGPTRMLHALFDKRNQIVSQDVLHEKIYGRFAINSAEVFKVHLCLIRKCLREGNIPIKIETIHRRGWKLQVESQQ